MAQEIERKFLVADDRWRAGAEGGRRLRQAYLADTGRAAIRVRIENETAAVLTIKSGNRGLVRLELEYPVPVEDAEALTELRQGSVLEKTRFHACHEGHLWEIDVYEGDNAGLVIAEVELERAEESVGMPPWVGREVTGEARYYASRLAMRPYRDWTDGGSA